MGTSSALPASAMAYSLGDLLGGCLTMAIPDMQRDYCWGKEKVAAFVTGIIRLYDQGEPSTLGILYGYENPKGSRRLHIIDGQQRLTTLYLLFGMLYRRCPEPWLRRLLISDYELIDDNEPRLLYQSRREAMYFMSDLATRFFLDRDGRLSQIERSPWFYASYGADDSVRHFLLAIRSIDDCLEHAAKRPGWDFAAFARFVAGSLRFLYWDLGDRVAAERAFITINTTGVPLTLSQSLRAISAALQGEDSREAMEMWNEMEDWFWARRVVPGLTLDALATMYLAREGIAMTGNLPVDVASLSVSRPRAESMLSGFYQFFKSVARISELPGFAIADYPLLACVRYLERFPSAGARDLGRVWRFFCNIARYQRPSAADAKAAVGLVNLMPGADTLAMLELRRGAERFLNSEERAKLEYVADHLAEREAVEKLIDRAERHPMLNGRVAKLLDWSDGSLDRLRGYVDAIYAVWGSDIDKKESLDLLRRALLTIRHREYPIVRRGETVLSLCWNDYDWQRLMLNAPGLVRQLLDRVSNFQGSPSHALGEMIARFADQRSPYFAIVKRGDLLRHCRKRQLLRPCPPFLGIFDLEMATTRWMVNQQEIVRPKGWGPIRQYGNRCLYTDHKTLNVAVDLYYRPDDRRPYRIELLSRSKEECAPERQPCNLRAVAASYGGLFRLDKARSRFVASFPGSQRALSVMASILTRFLLAALPIIPFFS